MTQLIKYDAACQAIAEAKAVDEVKDVADKAVAIQAYAKQAKNRQLEIDAAEIRMRAERRLGEMIRAQKETAELMPAGRPKKKGSSLEPFSKPLTLAEVGIDKKLSSRAQKMAAVPEEKFESMVGEWRERVTKENERVTTNLLREGERVQRDEKLKETEMAKGKYSLIYADPPWRYEHSKTKSREIENQYPTMQLEDICNLKVPSADDCVLVLWATSPKLQEAMQVISAWGFTYRTCAVWDKKKIGMGYYFRQQHELLLVATKGNPKSPEPSNRVSSVLTYSRGAHSKKPDEIYELLEAMYPELTKIELFARTKRDGWEAWGNQADAA